MPDLSEQAGSLAMSVYQLAAHGRSRLIVLQLPCLLQRLA